MFMYNLRSYLFFNVQKDFGLSVQRPLVNTLKGY